MASTPARCSTTSATATSRTQCYISSCAPTASMGSGRIDLPRPLHEACASHAACASDAHAKYSALPRPFALSTSTQASPPRPRQIGDRPASIGWNASHQGGVSGGPPGGGRARFENSSKPHPRKFGLKRFPAVRGPGGEVGWPIFGLPPSEKLSARAAAT